MLYTKADRPVGVLDEVDWYATVAVEKSRKEGTKVVPTTLPDPPQARGFKAALETGKQRPKQNAGNVAGRATERASAGRSAPIRTIRIRIRLNQTTGSARTMPKGRKNPKPEKGQPS